MSRVAVTAILTELGALTGSALTAASISLSVSEDACGMTFRLSPRYAFPGRHTRSEEHTSELQSHLNLVCRLLLEKKKTMVQANSLTIISLKDLHERKATLLTLRLEI